FHGATFAAGPRRFGAPPFQGATMSAASPVSIASRGIPLKPFLALLLMTSVLVDGAVLGVHNYRQTSRLALDAAGELFARTGREAVLAVYRIAAPVQTLVDVFAMQSLADATTLD